MRVSVAGLSEAAVYGGGGNDQVDFAAIDVALSIHQEAYEKAETNMQKAGNADLRAALFHEAVLAQEFGSAPSDEVLKSYDQYLADFAELTEPLDVCPPERFGQKQSASITEQGRLTATGDQEQAILHAVQATPPGNTITINGDGNHVTINAPAVDSPPIGLTSDDHDQLVDLVSSLLGATASAPPQVAATSPNAPPNAGPVDITARLSVRVDGIPDNLSAAILDGDVSTKVSRQVQTTQQADQGSDVGLVARFDIPPDYMGLKAAVVAGALAEVGGGHPDTNVGTGVYASVNQFDVGGQLLKSDQLGKLESHNRGRIELPPGVFAFDVVPAAASFEFRVSASGHVNQKGGKHGSVAVEVFMSEVQVTGMRRTASSQVSGGTSQIGQAFTGTIPALQQHPLSPAAVTPTLLNLLTQPIPDVASLNEQIAQLQNQINPLLSLIGASPLNVPALPTTPLDIIDVGANLLGFDLGSGLSDLFDDLSFDLGGLFDSDDDDGGFLGTIGRFLPIIVSAFL